jgi:alpha-galactosidase
MFGVRSTFTAGVAAIFLGAILLAAPAFSQGVTGRWAILGKPLANGEIPRSIVALTQTGSEITGKVISLGWGTDVKGTTTGSHFELFGVDWDDKKPFIVGDLVNSELQGTMWGGAYVAHPATPADEIPLPAYLEPPALHQVPYNRLAKTPPMGWNSWNLFADKVDDQTVRTMADAMVSSGMRDAGYIYVNIDDTWEGVRDAQGNLQANRKFPDMKALSDYVHSKGLKIGIYSSPGPRTCASYPASYGHEAQDANTFAAWGVDYLKYDWCSAGNIYKDDAFQPIYQKMGEALEATGRPIVYSLSVGVLGAANGVRIRVRIYGATPEIFATSGRA